MRQSYRLSFLEMSKSRHISVEVFLHDLKKRFQQLFQKEICLADLVPDIHLHIQSHLVVPASSGMKLLAHISLPVNEICLYKAVDIFIFRRKFQFPILDIF